MMYARYVYNCWRWSFSRWSDAFSRRHSFLVGSVLTVGPQRQEQPWCFRWRSLTRAQLTWGDINCRWGNRAQVQLAESPRWGSFCWGDRTHHHIDVQHEMFLHHTPVFADADTAVAVPSVLTARQGCRATIHDNDKWLRLAVVLFLLLVLLSLRSSTKGG